MSNFQSQAGFEKNVFFLPFGLDLFLKFSLWGLVAAACGEALESSSPTQHSTVRNTLGKQGPETIFTWLARSCTSDVKITQDVLTIYSWNLIAGFCCLLVLLVLLGDALREMDTSISSYHQCSGRPVGNTGNSKKHWYLNPAPGVFKWSFNRVLLGPMIFNFSVIMGTGGCIQHDTVTGKLKLYSRDSYFSIWNGRGFMAWTSNSDLLAKSVSICKSN